MSLLTVRASIPPDCWCDLAIVAKALADGRDGDVNEIGLMRDIAQPSRYSPTILAVSRVPR